MCYYYYTIGINVSKVPTDKVQLTGEMYMYIKMQNVYLYTNLVLQI